MKILQERIQNPLVLDYKHIDERLKDGWQVLVQFSHPIYTDKILIEINDLCKKYDHNFSVRFYGESFDCKTLFRIPDVKSIYLDCLREVKNLEFLTQLMFLKRLALGIFELKETDILASQNLQNLQELFLGETRTKAFNLKHITNLSNLVSLRLSGHTKNIDSVGQLSNLKFLSLNSISKVPLGFVNNLRNLTTLNIILGGRSNINEIQENNISNLEIVLVRGFNNFDSISNFKNLKTLKIEDQIQLNELHFDSQLPKLEDFKLVNCKSLTTLTGIDNLTALNKLIIYNTALDFDNFIKSDLPACLKALQFCTAKLKVDKVIKERLLELGYDTGFH